MKEKLQHGNLLYWNHVVFWIFIQNITFQKLKFWILIYHMFTSLERILVQENDMTCLWVDTISLAENTHMIIQKDVRYLVKQFTHNTSLVVSPFLWSDLRLSTLTNWNHSLYQWHNFIVSYLIKYIIMISLLRHILLLLLKNKW